MISSQKWGIAANVYCHQMVDKMKSTSFPYTLGKTTDIPRNYLCDLLEKHISINRVTNLIQYLVFH